MLLLVWVTVAACGTDAGSPPAAQPSPTAEAPAVFPVTIQHKYGTTEIPKAPERVVSVGLTDLDPLLALGVKPVAVRDWFGDQPYATWPWAQDELGDAKPQVLPSKELNFEQIAALRPDLIVGISSGVTDQEYATLSQIAPTVAQPSAYVDYGTPWQEQTRVIGRALGREEQAEELVAEVEARFAKARNDHPEFQGKTGVVALTGDPGTYYPYGPQDLRARFLTALGFELPGEIAQLAGDKFFATISRERFDLINTDLLVWIVTSPAEREALENDPLYQQLDVAREGRDIFLEYVPLGGALSFSTVLSLPFLLDQLVPQLAAAVDGNPGTGVTIGREPSPTPGRP
ncbi:MAG: iron-siderophore ABC transporter substrate-binding protein [Actinomycetota bacterium]|nr:iron-siderophore ABC transporter substrate-binding protein [Actinomycetota bacterium]